MRDEAARDARLTAKTRRCERDKGVRVAMDEVDRLTTCLKLKKASLGSDCKGNLAGYVRKSAQEPKSRIGYRMTAQPFVDVARKDVGQE
jgi:hypothetical protein